MRIGLFGSSNGAARREDGSSDMIAARTTAIMSASQVLNYFDRSVVAVASVDIMRDLNLTPAQYGLLASAFYSFYAVSGIVVGLSLSHRVRPRVLLAWLVASWTVLQLPVAFAPSLLVLIVCRAALGAAESPSIATAIAATHEWYPARRRNVPTALVMIGPAVGAIIAPPLLTAVNLHFGWRSGFLCCALLSACIFALIAFVGRDGPDSTIDQTTGPGAGAIAKPARMSIDPTLAVIALVGFSSYWVGAWTIAWLLPMLRLALGLEARAASWIVSGLYLANVIAMLTYSAVSQRLLKHGISARGAIVWPAAACLFAGAALLLVPTFATSSVVIVASLLGATSLMMPTTSAVPILISRVAPAAQRNRSLVVIMSLTSTSGLIAPYVSGLLIKGGGLVGYSQSLALCAGVAVFGGILAVGGLHPDQKASRWVDLA